MIRSPSKGHVRATAAKRNRRSRPVETSIILQEVLSRPGESEKPLNEQEHWVLALIDFTDSYRAGFEVQQGCARWSEIDHGFMCYDNEYERWPLLLDAEGRYEIRRRALVKKGLINSDMEF